MASVRIVENPRRRRGRPKKRRATRRRARRRNPGLAALAANPRRRRSASRGYRRRSYRRRSNPRMGLLAGIDLPTAAWVAGGMINVRVLPGLIGKVWKQMPTTGMGLYAVKFGSVILGGMVIRYIPGISASRSNQFMAGGLALVLFDVFNEYLAPQLGLYGLSGFVNTSKMPGMGGGVGKFVNYNPGLYRGASVGNAGNGSRVPAHVLYN